MELRFNNFKHQAMQPFPFGSNQNQQRLSSGLEYRELGGTSFLRASSSSSSFVSRLTSPEQQPSFSTYIPPSPLIQKRLTAGVKKSTIQVKYVGRVPQPVRAAFRYAANIWQTLISSRVPIQIQLRWKNSGRFNLGSNIPIRWWRNFRRAPMKNTWYPVALANKFAGKDLSPGEPDAIISLNRRQPWYFGRDGNVPQGKYDLVTIALHEIYHTLSSPEFMNYNPRNSQGSWGDKGFPAIYDRFTINGSGQRLLNTRLFPNPSKALGRELTGDNLFFNGTHAVNANGGRPPKLYAPGRWQPGSSYAHLDERTYVPGDPDSLITPFFEGGEAIHSAGSINLGILRDLGWSTPSLRQVRGGLIYQSRNWNEIDRTSGHLSPLMAIDFGQI